MRELAYTRDSGDDEHDLGGKQVRRSCKTEAFIADCMPCSPIRIEETSDGIKMS